MEIQEATLPLVSHSIFCIIFQSTQNNYMNKKYLSIEELIAMSISMYYKKVASMSPEDFFIEVERVENIVSLVEANMDDVIERQRKLVAKVKKRKWYHSFLWFSDLTSQIEQLDKDTAWIQEENRKVKYRLSILKKVMDERPELDLD